MIRRKFLELAASAPMALLVSRWALSSGQGAGEAPVEFTFPGDGPRIPPPRGDVGSSAVIAAENEPGERLVLSGTIFRADGVPASGVYLRVYQTDVTGYYAREGGALPRLYAWMRTGTDGRYEFRTIKPAPYPGRSFPAHIHAAITGPGIKPKWVDDYLFADDPLVAAADRERSAAAGAFAHVLVTTKGADGVLRAVRDIRL